MPSSLFFKQSQKAHSRKLGFGCGFFSETGLPLETVRKASRAGQSPRHQTTHRHIDERLAGLRQPLVVFAHPPVLIRPRKRAFHHPPPRQHLEAFSWQELLPIDLYSLFGPLLRPRLQDLFWGGLLRTLDELHTPP